jgi:hypothetical protein
MNEKKSPRPLSDRINANPVVFLLSTLFTGFLAGLGTYHWALEISLVELGPRRTSCSGDQVALRVDVSPADAKIIFQGGYKPYYQGICLKPDRYQLEATRDGYATAQLTVQLGQADQVAVMNLQPYIVFSIGNGASPVSSGERLTLNLQDIDVADALRLVGDAENTKVVVDPAVKGNVTLNLRNVPWSAAFDVILLGSNLKRTTVDKTIFVSPISTP